MGYERWCLKIFLSLGMEQFQQYMLRTIYGSFCIKSFIMFYWWGLEQRCCLKKKIELRNDKTNIMGLRPAWIQTSLRIRAVWSGSMLFPISFSTCYRVCKQTARILIRLRVCWFCHDAAQMLTTEARCQNNRISSSRFVLDISSFRTQVYHNISPLWFVSLS
jgi:hypothetical protein